MFGWWCMYVWRWAACWLWRRTCEHAEGGGGGVVLAEAPDVEAHRRVQGPGLVQQAAQPVQQLHVVRVRLPPQAPSQPSNHQQADVLCGLAKACGLGPACVPPSYLRVGERLSDGSVHVIARQHGRDDGGR